MTFRLLMPDSNNQSKKMTRHKNYAQDIMNYFKRILKTQISKNKKINYLNKKLNKIHNNLVKIFNMVFI